MPKIKHEPKFYIRLCKGTVTKFPDNFTIYPGSIYGRYEIPAPESGWDSLLASKKA